jgi:hypothetical protein
MHARENDDSWQPHPVGGQNRIVHPKLGQLKQNKEGSWVHIGLDGKQTHNKPFDHYSDAAYHAETKYGRKQLKKSVKEASDWQSSPDVQKYYHRSLGMIRHHSSEKGSHEGSWYHYSSDSANDPTHDKGFTTPKDAMSHAENLSKTKIKEDGTTTVDAMANTKPMAMPMRRALRAKRMKAKKTGDSYLKGKFESKKPR